MMAVVGAVAVAAVVGVLGATPLASLQHFEGSYSSDDRTTQKSRILEAVGVFWFLSTEFDQKVRQKAQAYKRWLLLRAGSPRFQIRIGNYVEVASI
jgi:hypothetical protein